MSDFVTRLRRNIGAARDRGQRSCSPPEVRLRGADVDALSELLDATGALAVALDELHQTKAEEYVNATVGIREMRMVDGVLTMELEAAREFTKRLVAAARGMLGEAVNYSETRVDFLPPEADAGVADPPGSAEWTVGLAGERDRYVIRIQRAGRVTPHEARAAAEADRDRLAGQCVELARDVQAIGRQVVEQAARVHDAEAERDRLRHDLAARGWQPLPADWHAQAEVNGALAAALMKTAAERDALVAQILVDAKAAGGRVAQDKLRAERDLALGQVRRVRDFADRFPPHTAESPCLDDLGCTSCLMDDIRGVLGVLGLEPS